MLIVKCQNTFIRVARSHYILQTSNSTHAGILSFRGFFFVVVVFFMEQSKMQVQYIYRKNLWKDKYQKHSKGLFFSLLLPHI